MKNLLFIVIATVAMGFIGCKNNAKSEKEDDKNVFSDKIVYEINLEKDADRPSWLEKLDSKKLVDYLIDNVLSGKLKAYDYFTNQYLTQKELKKIVESHTDTTFVQNPETGVNETKVTKYEFDRSDVKSLVFIEKWYIKDDSKFKKKVKGIGLVKHYYKKAEGENLDEKLLKDLLFVVEFNVDTLQ